MPTLRLRQTVAELGVHRVDIHLEDGRRSAQAAATVRFSLSDEDEEDLRWYLEDYLTHAIDPAPTVAARIQSRMNAWGRDLFGQIFAGDRERLWKQVQRHLTSLDVLICTDAWGEALPWELLTDPKTGLPVVGMSRSFMRATSHLTNIGSRADGPVRVLLVIARPAGAADVSFASVGSQLVRLRAEAGDHSGDVTDGSRGVLRTARSLLARRQAALQKTSTVPPFQLDVLRPPTFDQLERVLLAARDRGVPYHIVHIDAHGVRAPGTAKRAPRGYIVLEDPSSPRNRALVDGATLGELAAAADVPLVVLNACGSAGSELATPSGAPGGASETTPALAHGSFAREAADAGAAGVVAMRFAVYVSTAERLVASLYGALLGRRTLGEAVTTCRADLASHPLRRQGMYAHEIQDWMVPVAYASATVRLPTETSWPGPGHLSLPPTTPHRFCGRDDILFELDRTLHREGAVLLHGMAGIGKTSTASEFARWYAMTGGVRGPVAVSSLPPAPSLSGILGELARSYTELSAGAATDWDRLGPARRRAEGVRMLARDDLLWICDGLDPPPDRDAASPEWTEIMEFAEALAASPARILLVSVHSHDAWLGQEIRRVELGVMSEVEQMQVVRAVKVPRDRTALDPYVLEPILELSGGFPAVLLELLERATQCGIGTRPTAEEFARDIRTRGSLAGDYPGHLLLAALEQASPLQYSGISLLDLFQGFVDVGVLEAIADPDRGALAEVAGLDAEAWIPLLDTVVDAGFGHKLGRGSAILHPALPTLLSGAFGLTFPGDERRAEAHRAFATAMGAIGRTYASDYQTDSDAVWDLRGEEQNLSHALSLARANGWWHEALGCVRGLRALFQHRGKGPKWAALVDELRGDLIGSDGGPLPGREEGWRFLTDHIARIAVAQRRWDEAERLQRVLLAKSRDEAEAALRTPPDSWSEEDRHSVESLATDLELLGSTLREKESRECFELYREAQQLSEKLADRQRQHIIAFNLGTAYIVLDPRDGLDEAQRCFEQSLDLIDPGDRIGRVQVLGQLGAVHYQRARALQRAGQRGSDREITSREEARRLYHRSAEEAQGAPGVELISEYMLGLIYKDMLDLDAALEHLQRCIRLCEQTADWYYGGLARRVMASIFIKQDRKEDALVYARAAASYLRSVGRQVAGLVYETEAMVARLEGRPFEDGW